VYIVYCVMYQVCTVHCDCHIFAALNMESMKCEMASAYACAHYLPMHLSLHQQAGLLHNGCCKLACNILVAMLGGTPSDAPANKHHHHCHHLVNILRHNTTVLCP
jgi:hypothetical protein